MKWTAGAKIGAGFGAALAILIIVGAVAYRGTNKLIDSSSAVAAAHEMLENTNALLTGLIDAETGQRGYIITGDAAYLEPFEWGSRAVRQRLQDLHRLTESDARQSKHIGELDVLVDSRMESLERGIEIRRTRDFQAAEEWVLTGQGKKEMDEIRQFAAEMVETQRSVLAARATEAQATADTTRRSILIGTIIAFVVVFAAGFLITRDISTRLRSITAAAASIAQGDLTGADLNVRSQDEIGALSLTFNEMRVNLRNLASQIGQATENVMSTAAEILASTQQQATAMKEQAATVQEITGTIEEINQSGVEIGDRARQVAVTVEATTAANLRGLKATEETSQTMEMIRTQVEEVAENIVALSERTQTIGEIIATVNEIAEQSNLLALNASIEAASAGAQGTRFSVVAHEMKSLADRAKDCTVQVRTILGEVQRGINSSVMLTEGAVKRVESGKQQANLTEESIRQLNNVTERSIQAFQQIVGGTGQQQIGVTQVTQGMQDIRQAVTQTAAGTTQLEKAAANLNALSHQLRTAVEKYQV